MPSTPAQNKATVIRFNEEFIGQGNLQSFRELVAEDVVNHTAPPGSPQGSQGMSYFILDVLRKGFPDIRAEILDQIAEGDTVATRKILHGTHSGDFLGIPPTGKEVAINVMDFVRIRDGKYVEHWGMSNINDVVKRLKGD